MTEKSKTLLTLFFILVLAAGPGFSACAQAPEETDADEIIDCSSDLGVYTLQDPGIRNIHEQLFRRGLLAAGLPS